MTGRIMLLRATLRTSLDLIWRIELGGVANWENHSAAPKVPGNEPSVSTHARVSVRIEDARY